MGDFPLFACISLKKLLFIKNWFTRHCNHVRKTPKESPLVNLKIAKSFFSLFCISYLFYFRDNENNIVRRVDVELVLELCPLDGKCQSFSNG